MEKPGEHHHPRKPCRDDITSLCQRAMEKLEGFYTRKKFNEGRLYFAEALIHVAAHLTEIWDECTGVEISAFQFAREKRVLDNAYVEDCRIDVNEEIRFYKKL